MDLVDEEHVALFEVRQNRGQIAGSLDRRTARGLDLHAEFVGDDLRERRLAQPRRSRQQDVVERLVARPRGLDEHAEVLLDARLTQVLGEPLRPQVAVDLEVVFGELRRDEPLGFVRRRPSVAVPPRRCSSTPPPSRRSACLSSAWRRPASPS